MKNNLKVGIIGLPNSGKSTLLNALCNKNISMVHHKKNTTIKNIEWKLTYKNLKIIFIDTPGYAKINNKKNYYFNENLKVSTHDINVVLVLIDVNTITNNKKLNLFLKQITQNKLCENNIFLLNKIDLIDKKKLFHLVDDLKNKTNNTNIIPISAKKQINLDYLLKFLYKNYFNKCSTKNIDDEKTNIENIIINIIHKEILNNLNQEVPYGIKIKILKFKNMPKKIILIINLDLKKANYKKILIGKNGVKINAIKKNCIYNLNKFFNKKTYLNFIIKENSK